MSKYFTLILILISIFTIGCEKQQTGKMANILGVTDEPVVTEITDEPTEEPVEEPPVDEPEVEPPPIVFEPEVEPILEGVLPTDNVVRVDELPEDITIFETIDELYAHEDVKAWFKEAEEWISGVCKGELNPFEKRPQTYFYFTTREVRNSFEKSYPGKAEGKKLYCHRFFRPHPKGRLCYNTISLERSYPMAKRRKFTPEFKAEVVLEVLSGATSQAEVCRRHNLNENQLSQWKRQLVENASTLFDATDKQSSDAEKRIAHLEQLVGRLTVALDIQKKALDWLK